MGEGLLKMNNILNRSDRRVAILDIEASALETGSFPIEVGIALVQSPSDPIGVGAKLIQPDNAWLESGVWSKSSEAVHGLSLERIKREGEAVEDVCDWLNGFLGANTIVASDAPRYDQDWLDTLFAAAKREQMFRIFDFEVLTRDFGVDQHGHLSYLLRQSRAPHRAAADAWRLASNLMETHWGYPARKGLLPLLSDQTGISK